jgi:hypothetical protein
MESTPTFSRNHFGHGDVVVNNAVYALKGEVEAVSDELTMMLHADGCEFLGSCVD